MGPPRDIKGGRWSLPYASRGRASRPTKAGRPEWRGEPWGKGSPTVPVGATHDQPRVPGAEGAMVPSSTIAHFPRPRPSGFRRPACYHLLHALAAGGSRGTSKGRDTRPTLGCPGATREGLGRAAVVRSPHPTAKAWKTRGMERGVHQSPEADVVSYWTTSSRAGGVEGRFGGETLRLPSIRVALGRASRPTKGHPPERFGEPGGAPRAPEADVVPYWTTSSRAGGAEGF